MSNSQPMRKLINAWKSGDSWPKLLEWVEIDGIRGWTGQRIDLNFPIVVIAGENGVGKSTVLQAIKSVYRGPGRPDKKEFASAFFPDTPWERVTNCFIRFSYRQGTKTFTGSIRKPTSRWLGNPDRPTREVQLVDLRRTQPIASILGYQKLAKKQVSEQDTQPFSEERLASFSDVLGTNFDAARHANTDIDNKRYVPVVVESGEEYSGFHQGAGVLAMADLFKVSIPKNGILLVDEIETSLHPRVQRRLIRHLATECRRQRAQVILTSHSPYVLEEIPPEGRMYVMRSSGGRSVIRGVSPHFAMTMMDEDSHPEVDIYVEDDIAKIWTVEMLARGGRELVRRVQLIPYGAASTGKRLGLMASERRFPRPSIVTVDGDQEESTGCFILPGSDAPERVVFEGLKSHDWPKVAARIDRSHSTFVDAAEKAMLAVDHHEWVRLAADELVVGGNSLWRAMASEWSRLAVARSPIEKLVEEVNTLLADAAD